MHRFIIICIAIATISNGANFWLKKAGWLQHDILLEILNQRDIEGEKARQIYEQVKTENIEQANLYLNNQLKEINNQFTIPIRNFLRGSPGLLIINKLLKYCLLAFLVFYCIAQMWINRSSIKPEFLTSALLIYLLFASLISAIRYGPILPLSGIPIYIFVPLALTGGIFTLPANYQFLINILKFTLIVFIVMAPIELYRHIQLISPDWFYYRFTGFMNLPNSMGIYLVCIYSIVASYFLALKPTNLVKILLSSAVILIGIILTGSTSAVIAFICFWAIYFFTHFRHTLSSSLLFIISSIVIFFLYAGRTQRDVLQSLSGRIEKFERYLSTDVSTLEFLFGQGVGYSSNLLINLRSYLNVDNALISYNTDSTPLALFIQIGIVGMILVYGLFIRAALKDRQQLPVYACLCICSLTINIFEVFPLNILLGILLAKSFSSDPLLVQHIKKNQYN